MPVKKLLQSRLLADYGSVLVLLVLCAYYSYATMATQHPITPTAGEALARRIVEQHGQDARVLVIVRDTDQDRRFARALQQQLISQDARVLDVISGQPVDARQALVQFGNATEPVDAVAINHPVSQWRPLQREGFAQLARQNPMLRDTQIYQPASYRWPSFLMPDNLLNVVKHNVEIAVIAIGMTLVIITAGIDLSVGSVLALCGVLSAVFIQHFAGGAQAAWWAITLAVLAAVSVGGLCGAFNGAMVTWFRVPAFIVTLATMMIARGLALILSVSYQSFLSGGTTEGTPEAIRIEAKSFGWLGNGEVWSIPVPVIVMLLLYAAAHFVMSRTALGRYIYAVGGNEKAAWLSGVPVKRVIIIVYTICAVMACVGGVLDASRFHGGRPNAGNLYELKVIAAVVVGGTSLSGGEGRVLGTLVGAMIIAVIQNGLNMAGVGPYEQMVVFGLLILGAVLLDLLRKGGWKRH